MNKAQRLLQIEEDIITILGSAANLVLPVAELRTYTDIPFLWAVRFGQRHGLDIRFNKKEITIKPS